MPCNQRLIFNEFLIKHVKSPFNIVSTFPRETLTGWCAIGVGEFNKLNLTQGGIQVYVGLLQNIQRRGKLF